jgi:hypothetical protein
MLSVRLPCWAAATARWGIAAVIPGRAEGANPESRNIGIGSFSGFRVRRFAAPRNDVWGFFSNLLERIRRTISTRLFRSSAFQQTRYRQPGL